MACGAATTMSHMAISPMPPAMQAPLTRAISGTLSWRLARNRLAMLCEGSE